MTLREALDLVPDFRSSQGRRHSLGAILALATCAMLCGARSLYAIAQWGRDQGGATAQLLGFSQEKTPCVATLHRVFKGLDVAAFEAEVGNWLANSGVEADDPLSLDGKTLRGVHGQEIPGVHLVSAYASRAGAVLAQVAAPGKGEELAAVKEVLGQVPLKGRVVVADALLTQRKVCEQIVAGGGEYLLPATLRRDLEVAFSPEELRGLVGQPYLPGWQRSGHAGPSFWADPVKRRPGLHVRLAAGMYRRSRRAAGPAAEGPRAYLQLRGPLWPDGRRGSPGRTARPSGNLATGLRLAASRGSRTFEPGSGGPLPPARGQADGLGRCSSKAEGATFVFPRCDGTLSSAELATLLVEQEGVVVTPGVGFGECGVGHFRIALMRSPAERVVEGAQRIARALAEL